MSRKILDLFIYLQHTTMSKHPFGTISILTHRFSSCFEVNVCIILENHELSYHDETLQVASDQVVTKLLALLSAKESKDKIYDSTIGLKIMKENKNPDFKRRLTDNSWHRGVVLELAKPESFVDDWKKAIHSISDIQVFQHVPPIWRCKASFVDDSKAFAVIEFQLTKSV